MTGLSEIEVKELRKMWGYNEIPSKKNAGVWGVGEAWAIAFSSLILANLLLLLSIFIKPIGLSFEFEKPAFARYWIVLVGGLLFLLFLERTKKIKSGA